MNDVLGIKMYSPKEAMKIMGIGKNKMYELINSNKIEYVDLGGKCRLTEKGIKEYVEDNTHCLGSPMLYPKG